MSSLDHWNPGKSVLRQWPRMAERRQADQCYAEDGYDRVALAWDPVAACELILPLSNVSHPLPTLGQVSEEIRRTRFHKAESSAPGKQKWPPALHSQVRQPNLCQDQCCLTRVKTPRSSRPSEGQSVVQPTRPPSSSRNRGMRPAWRRTQ
jgi:hypothetical protein